MADFKPPGSGAKGGGGLPFLKNLNPKQRRYAIVIGVGALMAIFVIMRRSSAAGAVSTGPTPSDASGSDAVAATDPAVAGSGATEPWGSDPSNAFLGSFTSSVTSALGALQADQDAQAKANRKQVGRLNGRINKENKTIAHLIKRLDQQKGRPSQNHPHPKPPPTPKPKPKPPHQAHKHGGHQTLA